MIQRHDPGTPLSGIVSVPDRPRASANIERDAKDRTMAGYIPSSSAIEAAGIFAAGLGKGAALSIVGPYGSGKSTFGIILGHLAGPRLDPGWNTAYLMLCEAAPDTAAALKAGRRRAGLHERGMIRCAATAKLEPVAATVLQAAASGAMSYFGTSYGRRNFTEAGTLRRCVRSLRKGTVPDAATVSRIVASMAEAAPVLLVIDEFGKNVEYFADGGSDGDLFLLQDLAEMTGASRGIPLHMVTMQHMALGEYVAGSPSAVRIKEWAKIQGRFESVYFSNSLEHTRALLSSSLKPAGHTSHLMREWASQHSKDIVVETGMDIPAEIVATCYPLHPLAVEALPELCSRYGQNDRTLLSFVFGSGPGTVSRFIEKTRWDGHGILPTMGADHLYDYFISGSAPNRAGAAASSSRLVEIDAIIRDDRVSNETEQSVLKAIGVMNLIGRSGRLRASMGMIRCLVGSGAERAVRSLESRSVITYRHHADEYRVWHGTDVNIAAKLDAWKKTMLAMTYPALMGAAMDPDPVVAAKHGIKTGTMRVFASLFDMPKGGIESGYDGAMIYGTDDAAIPASERPVLVSRCRDTTNLAAAAAEVAALRAVLKDEEVANDWVAKREVSERLAAAENVLGSEFDGAYGAGAVWVCRMNGRNLKFKGTAGSAASAVSDAAYPRAAPVHNEMINRNRLTAQGSMALNRLMHHMIENEGEERLGLEGWKPERAIYEAVIDVHGFHKRADKGYRFSRPDGQFRDAWRAVLSRLRGARRMVGLTEIYHTWKMPPYGIKDGVMPILALLIILAVRDRVAVYEHGSYISRINSSLAERLVKNPKHFSLKYYPRSAYRVTLIKETAASLGTDPEDDMLGIVRYLVRVVRALPAYTKRTRNLGARALAVRDAIQNAIEPDRLLFETLPSALDTNQPDVSVDDRRAAKFAGGLARAVGELQAAFDTMMNVMKERLFKETGMLDRASLAGTASKLLPDVSDQKMKVFLGAVSADIPDEQAWINYVGLVLAGAPPVDWSDEHREMFANGLRETAAGFRRLAALRFATVSDGFGESSVMVTITHPDGREERTVLPANDERVSNLID